MLSVRDLDVYYGDAQALDGVGFDVAEGTVSAIVGANGAGKTSLIRTIAGMHTPARGRIVYRGQDIAGWPSHKVCDLGIGQVAEGRQVFPSLSIAENLETIRTTSHTRYPLCDGTLDRTVGLIHVKDLFLAQLKGPGRTIQELKREILFVPENSTVERLLSQFIEHKTHMAVVLDEYGGASGIVSLENITEELFGQIQDEFDRERPEIEPLGNGRYRVRGDYLIEDLADRLKVDVGEPAEETIGGYVAARLEREIVPGDRTMLGELSIEVIDAEKFRVRWVIVQTQMPPVEEIRM